MSRRALFLVLAAVLSISSCSTSDPVLDHPGLHVLSEYGDTHVYVSKDPSLEIIERTVRGLDWNMFHQVFLVKQSGESMEVGGSLDPKDGLSSVYRHQEIYRVTKEPPGRVGEMIEILKSFYLGDGRWEIMYEYERIEYDT